MDEDIIAERIRKLVSDGSIRHNAFLRKHVLRNHPRGGDLPWTVVHSCRSFRNEELPRLLSIISKHLSDQLVIHRDRQSITRIPPFTFDDMDSHVDKTLILDNFPTETSHENPGAVQNEWAEMLQAAFKDCGNFYVRIQHRLVSRIVVVPPEEKNNTTPIHPQPKRFARKFKPAKRGWATVEFDTEAALQVALVRFNKEPLVLMEQDGATTSSTLRASSLGEHIRQIEDNYWKAYCQHSATAKKYFGTMEIPQWKNIPIQPNNKLVYLYNLKVKRLSEGRVAGHDSDTDDNDESVLGLLLPIHLGEMSLRSTTLSDSNAVVFRTTFTAPTREVKQPGSCLLSLFEVELSFVRRHEALSISKLRRLRQFNQALWRWKTYGQGYSTDLSLDQAHKQQAPPSYVPTEATALFVPWKKNNLKEIDWEMINFETNRILIPLWDRLYSAESQDHLFQTHMAVYFKQRFLIEGPFEGMDATSTAKVDQKTRSEYDLQQNVTYEELIFKRYRTKVPNPSLPLLRSTRIQVASHLDYSWPERPDFNDADHFFLCQDFVEFLPIPLSVLKVMSMASSFMPELERKIDLCLLSHQFTCHSSHFPAPALPDLSEQQAKSKELYLVELLRTATTIHPGPTYDRLEFLGDTVLKYFLGLNAIAKNQGFEKDCEEMNDTVGYAGKNKILATAASNSHIQNILYMHHDTVFRSCYESQPSKKIAKKQITGKQWSDCIESLIGALYLADKTGTLCIELLEMISLPSSKDDNSSKMERWFIASGCCLEGPYPVQEDLNLQAQLAQVFSVLSAYPGVRKHLEDGRLKVSKLLHLDDSKGYIISSFGATFHNFVNLISSREASSIINAKTDKKAFTLLLQVALFDDSLDLPTDPRGHQRDQDNFLPVVMLREALYVQGGWALELFVTQELYQKYSLAASNDFHMQRACIMNDDVLSYILIKSGLRDCFYDNKSESVLAFEELIAAAEKTSKQQPNTTDSSLSSRFVLHKYPGLAGGRLVGMGEKVSKKITEELMVSFKSLFGALVLGLGAPRAWKAVRPFFDELLALSPNDWRRYYANDPTSVVASYLTKAEKR